MPIVHHIPESFIRKHSVAICGSQGWVAATTGWNEVTCPACLEAAQHRVQPTGGDVPQKPSSVDWIELVENPNLIPPTSG